MCEFYSTVITYYVRGTSHITVHFQTFFQIFITINKTKLDNTLDPFLSPISGCSHLIRPRHALVLVNMVGTPRPHSSPLHMEGCVARGVLYIWSFS